MRIASWNVNSVRTRLDHVLAWLDRTDVDLLALQETKVDDPLFPLEPFQSRGYEVSIYGQKSYNGVALISRHPWRMCGWASAESCKTMPPPLT